MRRFIRTGTENNGEILALAKELCISTELACALYHRGARDAESMREFLYPGIHQLLDPFGLPDMEKAVHRIKTAISAGERICVYGDYDVDGICATASLLLYLRSVGAAVQHYIPSRHTEGYGMNANAVAYLKKQGVDLIVTVDNGIAALGEIDLCRELGMDIVVTDHHRCMDELPKCAAVVNATRPDSRYANHHLCGAGVALKLIEALAGTETAVRYLPFAGLATVADVVPLLGENRALTVLTLRAMNEGNCPVGLQKLAEEANEKHLSFTVRDLAFGIAPRLNAAGRIGDAEKALELFCEQDPERAASLARELSTMNSLRQSEERKILAEAEELLKEIDIPDSRMLVLHNPDWNSGIVGIVASRLVEKYDRPVFLFCGAGDEVSGSGRSIPGVNLFDALKAHASYFIRFGGHAGAAGATLKKADLNALSADLDAWLRQNVPDECFIPASEYEFETDFSSLSLALAEELERLAPFGEGNPIPAFYAHGVHITNQKFMGQEQQHVRFSAVKGGNCVETVAFQWGDRMKQMPLEMDYDMVFRIGINEWQGRRRLQLILDELGQSDHGLKEFFPSRCEHKFFDAFLRNVLYNSYIVSEQIQPSVECTLSKALCEDISGTLVLCFTPSGAAALADELSAFPGRADLSFNIPNELSLGYNAIVFAPMLEHIRLDRYKRIVLYDDPRIPNLADVIRVHADHAQILKISNGNSDWNAFKNCDISRNGISEHYRVLRAYKEARYASRSIIIDCLRDKTGTSYEQCAFAAQVFTELDFLVWNGTYWSLDASAAQRRLDESVTFAFAATYSQS